MWRPDKPVEEDILLPGIDPQTKRRRSRRRAWRDGLAVQTIIENLEDGRSYRLFERAIVAGFGPRSVIELELTCRLASLFWRIRRASAIETGLFEIQGELLHGIRSRSGCGSTQPEILQAPTQANGSQNVHSSNGGYRPPTGSQASPLLSTHPVPQRPSDARAMAQCFLRLSNLDPTLLGRVGAYETRLWRQAAQTIWTLEEMRRPPPAPTRRPFRKPVSRFYWDAER